VALSASELAIIIKAQDQASSVFRQVQQSAGGMNSSLSKVATTAVGFAAGTIAVQGFGMALDGIKEAAVGFNSKLEQTAIAWKTFTGSAEGAQAVIQQVQQIAASPPFEFEDVNRAALRFVNAGMSAQQALNFITPLSNAIAAVGGNSATVDEVSRAISQIGAKGKVSAEEINQLAEAGINGWNVLAQAIGKPIPVIQQMAQQGQISARQFNDAFAQFFGAGSKFADAATDQAKSFQGSLSTISDQLKFVGATAFKPLFDAISQLAQRIATFVQSDQFTIWGGRMQAVVGLVLDGLGYLGKAFENALGSVFNTVSSVGQSIYQALQWINPFARHSPSLVEQVEGGVSAIEDSYSRLGSASGAFDNVRASFEQLTQTTEAFTQQFGEDLPTKTEKALELMGPGARDAFDSTRDAMDAAKQSLQDINEQWQAQTAALQPLKAALDGAKDGLQDQQRALSDLRGRLEDAKAAYEPLKEQLHSYEQAAKDAEGAIKDLSDAQLQGSAEMQKRIADANIALKQQELSFSRLKQSDAYKVIGQQIDSAQDKIRQLQGTEAKSTAAREEQRKAIQAQRDLIDQLKDKQEAMLAPAQRELDQRRDSLDAIRLERDATIGLAEDRVKAAATAALGGKEVTEQQVMDGIAAAKAARDKALSQAGSLKPQVANQERDIATLEQAIRNQEHTVASAQAAVDKASEAYDTQKESVDALADSYRSGKAELQNYDQQVRQLIQTADLQIQKAHEEEAAQKRAAEEAKKAAKAAAQAGQGSVGNSDVAAGLDLDAAKKKAQAFADEVQRTRDRVTGALAPVNTAFAAVSNAISPMLNAFRGLSPQVQAFGLVAGGLVLAAGNLAPLFIGLGTALAGLASPVALLVIGLAALGAAVVTNLGGIRDTILVPLTSAAQNMLVALAPLGEAFNTLATRVQAAFAQLVAGDLPGALGSVVGALSGFRNQLVEITATWAATFLDWVMPLVPQLLDELLGLAAAILGWIEDQAGNYLTKLLAWGDAFVSWLTPRLPAILAMLSTVALRILEWIGDQGTQFVARLGVWATAFVNWVIPMLPRLAQILEQVDGAVIDFVLKAVPVVARALAQWATTFVGWVMPLIPPLLGALAEVLGQLITWVVEVAVPKIAAGLAAWAAEFIAWVGPQIGPLLLELGKLLLQLAGWIEQKTPEIVQKLVQWGTAFVGWVAAEVLPRIGAALDFIINGGSGWQGLKSWIPAQVVILAGALGAWSGAFVAWIIDVVRNLPEELPKIVKAIGDWVGRTSSDVKQSAVPIGEQMIAGIISGLGGLKDALLKTAGDAFTAFKTEFVKSLGGAQNGLASAGAQKGGSDTIPQIIGGYLTQAGLTADQISAFCGPLAAEAIRRGVSGVATDIPTLLTDALKSGWTSAAGQGGTGNFQNLLSQLGIPSVVGSLSDAVKAIAAGIPVAISTGAHYYVAQGLDDLGKFIVGESGKAVGQATHLTLDEIDRRSKEITQKTLGVAVGVQGFVIPTLQGLQKGAGDFGTALLQMGDSADAGMTALGQNLSTNTDALKNYIAQAAILRGIDPATALQVAAGETGNFTKFIGDLNSSFGPFQLHLGNLVKGPNSVSGLGDEFKKLTGLDVTSVTTWPQQIDFALDYAAKHGWAAWHAAAATGIGDFQGIGTVASVATPALETMASAIDDAGNSVVDLSAHTDLWQQIQANATETGRTLQQFLGDTAAPSIDLATASLEELQARSGLTLPEVQKAAGLAGEDVRHWLLEVGVPAADALRAKFGDTTQAAHDLGGQTSDLQQPAKDAQGAFGDLGTKLGEVASNQATQIAAVLLQLRDGLLGEGNYSGKGLIKAVNDFIEVLSKIPRDITVNVHYNNSGGPSSSAGGGSGGGGNGGSKSSSAASDLAGEIANLPSGNSPEDASVRDQFRSDHPDMVVGRDDQGNISVSPKATGGPVSGGSSYLVGERGMELFTPSSSGSITPNNQLIDYDRLGDAVARALLGVSLSVDVDQIHSAFLQKKRANGTLGLS
jgi:tape measure domain-containing protein